MGRLMHHVLIFLSVLTGVGSSSLWLWAQFAAPMNFEWSLRAGLMPNYRLVIERQEVSIVRNSTIYGIQAEKCDFLTQLCKHRAFSICGIRFLGIADHAIYGPAYDGGYSVQAELHVRFGVLFAVFAALAGLAAVSPIRRSVRSATRPGCCPSCGYDLRGSSERCPECGTICKALTRNAVELQSRARKEMS